MPDDEQKLSELPEPEAPEDLAAAFNLSIQLTDELLKVQEQLEQRMTAMETELAATNRFLTSVLLSMHSGLIAVDSQERIVAFNEAAETILGIRAQEAFGRLYSEVVKEKDAGRATGKYRDTGATNASMGQVLKEGSALLNVEQEALRPDGSTVGVSHSISAIRDEDDQIIGAVDVFKDLSEIWRLEERLERSDRLAMVGQMSATVAHEIRNPLNGIEGFAGLLARQFPDDDSRHHYAQNILDGVRTLNKTVTDLLEFARPTRLNLRQTKLSVIFEQALFFLREEIKNPVKDGRTEIIPENIEIETSYSSEADELVADPEHLRGTFLNFLKNAAQAMPGGGTITVTTEPAEDNRIRARIADTGTGIDPEIKAKLFTPFITTKEHGTGLGLAQAKKIIEEHQGSIEVESEPGKGTTFVVTLPVDPRMQ
jgi:PAS domain S-box-containing protein